MNQDKVEEGMLVAQEGMLLNRINIQTILQLLVEKGILTREEVQEKREYVSSQRPYKNSLDGIYELQKKNREGQYFSQEFAKYINSDRQDGDIDFIKQKLGIED